MAKKLSIVHSTHTRDKKSLAEEQPMLTYFLYPFALFFYYYLLCVYCNTCRMLWTNLKVYRNKRKDKQYKKKKTKKGRSFVVLCESDPVIQTEE